jgi:hypothetical protein
LNLPVLIAFKCLPLELTSGYWKLIRIFAERSFEVVVQIDELAIIELENGGITQELAFCHHRTIE